MNDQERQIISDIFTRLEQTAGQTRDPDAERFISDKVKAQPYAPYAMAQALYVQEEAMKSLNQQLEQLKAENEQLRQHPPQSGGIFSSIFGGSQRPATPPAFNRPGPQPGAAMQPNYAQPNYAQPQAGPWGGQPQGGPWAGQQAQAPASGGFLRSALTTAAGVAGGMVVGNALMNAFSGHSHSSLGSFSSADMSSMGLGDALSPPGGSGFQDASFSDGSSVFSDSGSAPQDASFSDNGSVWDDAGSSSQNASFDDGGTDFGSSGDDSWT